jgi:hypothetical protein
VAEDILAYKFEKDVKYYLIKYSGKDHDENEWVKA